MPAVVGTQMSRMAGFFFGFGLFALALYGLWQRGVVSAGAAAWSGGFTFVATGIGIWLWVKGRPGRNHSFTDSEPAEPDWDASDWPEERRCSALLERYAAPRREKMSSAQRAVEGNETFFGLIFLAPGALVLLTLFSHGWLRDEAVYDGGKLFWILLIVEVVGTGIVLALRGQRLGRLERRRRAFQHLASEIASGKLLDFCGAMRWLNHNWPAPTSPADLHASRDEHAVSGQVRGYRVLIDIEPHGSSDDAGAIPPRAVVVLAAPLPERFNHSPTAADLRAELTRLGFELECHDDAGLLARATEAGWAAFQTDPPQLQDLPLIADQLAHAVHSVRIDSRAFFTRPLRSTLARSE